MRWIAVANSFPTHLKVFFSFLSIKSYARNGGGGKGAAQASEQEIVVQRRQTRSSEESQCGFLFGLRNSTLNFFFGSRNSTLAFFGPKESQSKKPFFARFLTVFPTFSTILEKQFYLGGI